MVGRPIGLLFLFLFLISVGQAALVSDFLYRVWPGGDLGPVLRKAVRKLHRMRNPKEAEAARKWFFANGKDSATPGLRFLGVSAIDLHTMTKAITCKDAFTAAEVFAAMDSPFNEQRYLALNLLKHRYRHGGDPESLTDPNERLSYQDYVTKLTEEFVRRIPTHINNWQLQDISVAPILGDFLETYVDKQPLLGTLATSNNVWDRHAAILATYPSIRQRRYGPFDTVVTLLVKERTPLIRQTTVTILRQLGMKDEHHLLEFLRKNVASIPLDTLDAVQQDLSAKGQAEVEAERRLEEKRRRSGNSS